MAVTAQQIAAEKANEAKLNQLSDQIIGYTPFGQLYPLMKLASQTGQGAIPHKICIGADGRTVKVYKGTAGQLIGSFLKPTHEYITKYLSQGDFLKALAATTGIYGQIQDFQDQKNATCITITPNEIVNLVKSVPSRDPNTGQRRATSSGGGAPPQNTPTVAQQFLNKRNITITLTIAGSIGLFLALIKIGRVI